MSLAGTVAVATASIAVTSLPIEKSWNGPHAAAMGGNSPVKVSDSACAACGSRTPTTAARAAAALHQRILVMSAPGRLSRRRKRPLNGVNSNGLYELVRTTASVLAPSQ